MLGNLKPLDTEGILYEINGHLVYLIDGWAFEDDKAQVVKYGLLQSDLGKYVRRGQASAIAQFFMLVANGLIVTRHIFQGLERPLCSDDCMDGDKYKYIHSRKPKRDYEYQDSRGELIKEFEAPKNKVLAVIISKNIKHTASFPMVYGWIERWSWVKEDKCLAEAPINWADRYNKKLYTRLGG